LSLVGLSLAPVQNFYSRVIERRADTYALELTQNPPAFESAMRRLGDLNLADPSPSKFVKYTMYSHPPIAERIERAQRFATEVGD
jgi:STE24 endopeptidase